MIGAAYYDSRGKKYECISGDARTLTLRRVDLTGSAPYDVRIWKRKLNALDGGWQFFTEEQHIARDRANWNRELLAAAIPQLTDAEIRAAMLFLNLRPA